MNKYLIRFNKSKGQPGRGTNDHVWRVFESKPENGEYINYKEYLFKNFKLEVFSDSEKSGNMSGDDFNIRCFGYIWIDRENSTALIRSYEEN